MQSRYKKSLQILALLSVGGLTCAAPIAPEWTRTQVVGRTATAPGIGMNATEPVGSATPAVVLRSNRPLDNWVQIGWTHIPTPQLGGLGSIHVLWSEAGLHLSVRGEKQIGDRNMPPAPLAAGRDDPRIFEDDAVRLFLQPQADGPVFQFAVNSAGVLWDGLRNPNQAVFDASWNAAGVEAAAQDAASHYDVQLSIPFAALGIAVPAPGDSWRVNVLRTEQPSREQTSWSATTDFGDQPDMGQWIFANEPEMRTVRGTVFEAQSNQRIAGAFIETPEGIIRSDGHGEFELTVAHDEALPLRALGFQYDGVTQQIAAGATGPVEIRLPRLPEAVIESKRDALASEHGRHPVSSYNVFSTPISEAKVPGRNDRVEDLASARAISSPGFEYSPLFRHFQGCPIGLAVTPDGRLIVSYTAFSAGEGRGNMTLVDISDDGGKTWHTETAFSDGWRAPWGNFFHDPKGRLWLFIHRQVFRCDTPDQTPMEWQDLGLIGENLHPRLIGTSTPIVLNDGTWLYTVARHEGRTSHADVYVGSDKGERWELRGSAFIPRQFRNTPEPMTVQRKDGSLWMLLRATGGFIAESFSHDQGRTWTEVAQSHIPHTTSRFDIRRLQSGRLLLVKHPGSGGRVDMTAYLSEDDGKTWPYSLQLHEGGCTYPDAAESKDGLLHIVYDVGGRRSNRQDTTIRMAKIREADIIAGELVSEDAELDLVIVRAGPHPDSSRKFNFAWTLPEETIDLVDLRAENPQAQRYERGATLFSDRSYQAHAIPEPLRGATFLQLSIEGGQLLRMPQDGTLYVLTPTVASNRVGSRIAELEKQAFEQMDHPVVQLTNRTDSVCVIMCKAMQAGEVITFGKWAVPVFFPSGE